MLKIAYLNWLACIESLLIVSLVASAPILLTQDMVTSSMQQAAGSSVSAVVIFMGPHGVPFWTYEWKIKHGAGNLSVGISTLDRDFNLVLNSTLPSIYATRISFSNSPSKLTTSVDPVTAIITLNDLDITESGLRFLFSSTSVSAVSSRPLRIKYCSKFDGSLVTVIPEKSKCEFDCVGEIRCLEGYESRGGGSLRCLADATWNVTNDKCVPIIQNATTAVQATSPDEEDREITMVYAVGITNLTLFVNVMKSSFYSCMWSYKYVGATSQYRMKIEVYSSRKCKKDVISGFNETATCSVNSTMLSTTLTFMQPLKFGRMFANFSCDSNLYYNASFNIVVCNLVQEGVLITPSNDECGYGCTGKYSCFPSHIPINSYPVVCSETAWWNVTNDHCVFNQVSNWNLSPKNSTTYAVGYKGLVVNVSFHRSVLFNCTWKYGGEFNNVMVVKNGSCTNDQTGQRDSVNCKFNDSVINTQLKLNYALEFGKFEIAVKCNDILYLKVPIVVAYCSKEQGSAIVDSRFTECAYLCTGMFHCLNGFIPDKTSVTCGPDALWDITEDDCGDSKNSGSGDNASNGYESLQLLLFLIIFLFSLFVGVFVYCLWRHRQTKNSPVQSYDDNDYDKYYRYYYPGYATGTD